MAHCPLPYLEGGSALPLHVLAGHSLDVHRHSHTETAWDGLVVGQSRIVSGLVARCRDIGHLERLGWWLVPEEMQQWAMSADSRWWVALIPEGKGVAGRAGSMGSSSGHPRLTSFSRAAACVLSVVSLPGHQLEPRSSQLGWEVGAAGGRGLHFRSFCKGKC